MANMPRTLDKTLAHFGRVDILVHNSSICPFKGVAVLLASAVGDYINGVTISVDGGHLTK
jgi:NAD(P)-dependent dehydrogenase (short-subunit alcohol dehydrogenase family)